MMNDELLPRSMPGFISNCIEFRKNFMPTPEQQKIMTKIWQYSDCEEFKPSLNKKGQDKYNRKMLAIIISYLMRLPEGESQLFREEKEAFLKICFPLIEMFYDVAKEVHQGITMG